MLLRKEYCAVYCSVRLKEERNSGCLGVWFRYLYDDKEMWTRVMKDGACIDIGGMQTQS
jgi:hypothetical protein